MILKSTPAVETSTVRVLLVDSNLEVLGLISALLEHHGHEVRIATTGQLALTLAAEMIPDVIFTGLLLPDCTGFDLAQRLRALPASSNAFIVALSGYLSPYSDEDLTAAGFDHYLMKPVSIDQIIETLAGPRKREPNAKTSYHPILPER